MSIFESRRASSKPMWTLRGFRRPLSVMLQITLLATSCLFLSSCGEAPVITVAQLAALKVALSQIQQALSDAIAQADEAVKNDIKRVDTVAKDTIRNVDEVIQNIDHVATNQREEAARQGFAILAQTRELVNNSGQEIFFHVNESLASVAAILDAIPFVNIPDTVFAVSPYRMRADAREKQVSIFGYFPSIADNLQAITVSLDGQAIPLKRSVGRVFFDIPEEMINVQKPIGEITIQLPKQGRSKKFPAAISARLHFLNPTPYKFTIEAMEKNPAAYATLQGNPHTEYAPPEASPHLQAETLFNETVQNPANYEAAKAQIIAIQAVQPMGGTKECEDCADPSGGVVAWSSSYVDLVLRAPGCNGHVVDKGLFNKYWCRGGGSNFRVTILPTFTVRVKNVPEQRSIDTKTVQAGWNSVSTIDLPESWASAIVKLVYDDNFDHREMFISVTNDTPNAAAALYNVKVENKTKLMITTF